MVKTTFEELKQKLKEETLNTDETKYYLASSSLNKVLLKIEKLYNKTFNKNINIKNTQGIIEIKEYLKIKDNPVSNVKNFNLLNDSVLIEACIRNDIPNKILNTDEKLQVKEMFKLNNLLAKMSNKPVKEVVKEVPKEVVKEVPKEVLKFDFMSKIAEFKILSNQKYISKRDLIDEITKILTPQNLKLLDILSTEELLFIKKDLLEIDLKVKIVVETIERIKTLEYHIKLKEFKEKENEELLKKIEARKNGISEEDINKKPSKTEPIVIEAYLDDFNSSRSRFVMAVMSANNINLSFYNGLIKLINEDETFEEIYFSSNGNSLIFSSKKYLKDIHINTLSSDKVNDILIKQTNNKYFIDDVLNCLSIMHYINTFYNEKEKIEISLENISNIKINNKNDEEIKENTNIVYLTRNQNKKSIRTIRIKKGKRKIEGTFLIRGHWRKQKYLDGTKLIWIEPFWKGFGKDKQRVYKIIKNQSKDKGNIN
ncbi:hypothetical protein [Aliarcobacter cryaerophilus]|uniref:Uncharacterized protein n=1 Tax=Aliarcobacter cryaerophilus TaxID=28198 RepID=A0AA46NMG5_9BACT|nr:hypothetical protein [Aliarcobacter cryaerophilus]UYF42551.1 hypothetical protein NGX11_06465 [Aliarcobacter cryaerophilus]